MRCSNRRGAGRARRQRRVREAARDATRAPFAWHHERASADRLAHHSDRPRRAHQARGGAGHRDAQAGRGAEHEFQFRTRLFGPGMAIDAFELRDGSPAGYEFQVIGEPDEDPLELLGKLIGKMRRALALTHLEDTDHGPQVNDRLILRGTVDSDPDEDHRVPMVVIDGREISWDELGRMVAAFEGWQFKLEFRDRSEEV